MNVIKIKFKIMNMFCYNLNKDLKFYTEVFYGSNCMKFLYLLYKKTPKYTIILIGIEYGIGHWY